MKRYGKCIHRKVKYEKKTLKIVAAVMVVAIWWKGELGRETWEITRKGCRSKGTLGCQRA